MHLISHNDSNPDPGSPPTTTQVHHKLLSLYPHSSASQASPNLRLGPLGMSLRRTSVAFGTPSRDACTGAAAEILLDTVREERAVTDRECEGVGE